MIWHRKVRVIAAALLMVLLAGVVAPVRAQKGGGAGASKAELDKLRAEIERLRADLDAAMKDISALKAALGGGKVVPEQGQLYRGRSAIYWQEQLKDADPKTRLYAVEALGALAQKDKMLIILLIDTAKNDKDFYVLDKAITGLGLAGPDALPTLIELLNDKRGFQPTILGAIRGMGSKAKPAVPALVKLLKKDTSNNVLSATIDALAAIGPDAKEAIPALVETLGFCLEDIGKEKTKKQGNQPRFGTGYYDLNVRAVEALKRLDPNLAGEVKLPSVDKEFNPYRVLSQEAEDAWRMAHETLVKRYVKSK